MAIGKSGRVVLELDPETKKRIHDAVRARGLTLREWFLQQAEHDLLITDDVCKDQSLTEVPNKTP